MKRIIGIGACVYDTIIVCKDYPKEDTKSPVEKVFCSGGGPVSNALVVISKLGFQAEYLGAFAADAAGEYLLKDFGNYGVRTERSVRAGERSFNSYILLSDRKHTRTCVFDRGNIPDDPTLFDFSCIADADILHLDGNYLECALSAAKIAHDSGVAVSLDAGGLYSGIERLLPFVDILIPSAEFALKITGKSNICDAMENLQKQYAPQVLVVTDGKNGGYFYFEGKIEKYKSVPVRAVDTNGAGDTFHGAFLVAFGQGKDIRTCCNFAASVSAYKCACRGLRKLDFNIKEISAF